MKITLLGKSLSSGIEAFNRADIGATFLTTSGNVLMKSRGWSSGIEYVGYVYLSGMGVGRFYSVPNNEYVLREVSRVTIEGREVE